MRQKRIRVHVGQNDLRNEPTTDSKENADSNSSKKTVGEI
jgi:hypothetical protein